MNPAPVNVLIVDDQPANLRALESVLRDPGLNIVQAGSGNEALAHLLETDFACVILDVMMPGMDGFELARIIRADERAARTPIIFATAQRAAADVFKGYETGAVDYLMKPIDPVIVRSKVRVFADLFRAERRLARQAEELRRSNEDLDHFASVAAHDLQAPLRAIASFAGLLGAEYKGKLSEDADLWLERVDHNVKRMRALIGDLLDFARAGRGDAEADVDLQALVAQVLGDLGQPVEECGARVRVGPLPKLAASPVEMRQLFHNLIGNAIKYRRPDVAPEVELSCERDGDMWTFRLRDNGIGIAREYWPKIFVIFKRLHSDQEYAGTGLGLALCKKLVERRGGRIWLDSEPGRGTTFHFTLPAA